MTDRLVELVQMAAEMRFDTSAWDLAVTGFPGSTVAMRTVMVYR